MIASPHARVHDSALHVTTWPKRLHEVNRLFRISNSKVVGTFSRDILSISLVFILGYATAISLGGVQRDIHKTSLLTVIFMKHA